MYRDKYAIIAAIGLIACLAAVTLLPIAVGVVAAAPGLVLVVLAWWVWRSKKLKGK